MPHYENHGRETGVVDYEIGRGSIIVTFGGGDKYLYTNKSAGARNIARMQQLARDGRGLSTFISQHVHDRYARKLTSV
ncbi:MAG: hypothetical protein ABJB01_14140 [Rudaea sp.]